MKKVVSLVLSIVFVLSTLAVMSVNTSAADAVETPVFSVSQVTSSDSELKVDFKLESGSFNSMDISFKPSSGLKCEEITPSSACSSSGGMAMFNKDAYSGSSNFSYINANVSGYTTKGAIFTATFKITNQSLSSYTVTFDVTDCSVTKSTDGNIENISVQPVDPVFSANRLTISIVSPPNKTTYCVGEELSRSGLVVKATYLNGTSKNVVNISTTYDFSTKGQKTVTVKYTENNITATATFNVTVNDHVPGELRVVKKANCTEAGLKEQRCTVCNAVIHSETIPEVGHKYISETIKLPTYNETGENKTYCGVCNHVKESVVLPKCNADIDGSGVVNSRDALMILQHATGLKLLEGDALANADLNGNGTILSNDALLALQLATGLIKA